MTGLILTNQCFYPRKGNSLSDMLTDCYKQFRDYASSAGISVNSILKQTAFIAASDNSQYIRSREEIFTASGKFFRLVPPTSVIAQKPEKGSLVLELIIMEGLREEEITHRISDEASWLVIRKPGLKMVVASGSGEFGPSDGLQEQGTMAFSKIQNILDEESLDFSDIIRQWNYIEQITREEKRGGTVSQHYQVFNDVRSKFYNRAEFVNGFPAATGIGTDCGGITIDVIAARFSEDFSAIAIKSPVQKDAYSYTKEVLADNATMSDFCRTSPKFERAKIFISPESRLIFISGTAAIKGQVSIPAISADVQTEMTIQNILSLISPENLARHNVKITCNPVVKHLRVYVKYEKDIPQVKEVCLRHFPDLPAVYIIADICRPELLVEIEGLAIID